MNGYTSISLPMLLLTYLKLFEDRNTIILNAHVNMK